MTDAEEEENSYVLRDPSATYRMLIRHPHIGRTKGQTITITPMGQVKVDAKVPAPTECLLANQMVDHPYTRWGITEDA